MSLVIDIETTGLSVKHDRIVSIAWMVLDLEYNIVHEEYHVVKVDFPIPKSAVAIHGISHAFCQKHGVSLKDTIIPRLKQTLLQYAFVYKLVAHNLRFDKTILFRELADIKEYRLCYNLRKLTDICTMHMTRRIMQLDRNPSLNNSYKLVCGKDMLQTKAHNAQYDTQCCASVYRNLSLTKHQSVT
jgi:DNA polymerase III epsilon subunit-like protein